MLNTTFKNIRLSRPFTPKDRYCIIDTRGNGGMFANLYCILYGVYICLKEEKTPVILMNGEKHLYYEQQHGENTFEYYFRPTVKKIKQDLNEIPQMLVINPDTFIKWCRVSQREKKMANFIINNFLILKKDIAAIIDRISKKEFGSSRVLGVHYRGRDKVTEIPILPFSEYERKIDSLLSGNICDLIFFCSDELSLREYVKNKYKNKVFLYNLEGDYTFHQSSEGKEGVGLHFHNITPYLHGKDTIIECYLLSKCHLLLSSSFSSFSLFSTFINPDLTHIVLNS